MGSYYTGGFMQTHSTFIAHVLLALPSDKDGRGTADGTTATAIAAAGEHCSSPSSIVRVHCHW